jgi:hypothetical protein
MKRLWLVLLMAGLGRAATITANITYTFTTAVACSSTVTVNCMSNFQVGILNGSTFTAFSPVVPLPATLVGTVTLPPANFTLNGMYGTIQLAVVAVGKDWQGNNITSVPFAPATAVVTVSLPPATGLTVSASQ